MVATTAILNRALRALNPIGADGFEGLVAHLIGRLTGHRIFLSATGRQEGRDMRARTEYGTQIAVECKRYTKGTRLDERDLVAELAQAINSLPQLDLWVLVASRSVPDQIEKALRSLADHNGVAFEVLQSSDDSLGDLAVLCAEFANDVLIRLPECARGDVQGALEAVRATDEFAQALARLRRTFSSSWIGFDQARHQSHAWLRRGISNTIESKAAFAQHLAVILEALPRARLLTEISAWFEKRESLKCPPLAILGQEGDGKTWLVADWLNRHIGDANFPLVLFVHASLVTATETADLLSKALTRVSEGIGSDGWRKRVQRWSASSEGETPRMILVLDGVNEKFSHIHWRNLFASLDSSGWREQLHIILTCRTTYWNRHFSGAFDKEYTRLVAPPYNDEELDAALKERNVRRDELSTSIFPLIRKPRYFDLAARHHKELAKSGDITVARLLYEDWHDRYERHINTSISPEDFNNFLKRTADSARAGERDIRPIDALREIPILDDQGRQELFSDLTSAGVLSEVNGGRFEVSPPRLQMGLGLLLVDLLLEAEKRGVNLSETISSWLEPDAGIDEKSNIVEHAVLHSLVLDSCSDHVRSALLGSWLGLQNRDDPACRNFTSYLPLRPSAFFQMAPDLWKTSSDHPWGQQLLLEGILRWRNASTIQAQAVAHATDWLGYVFTHSPESGRSRHDEHQEDFRRQSREKLESNLRPFPPVGRLQLGPYLLTFVDDEGLTRLGRVALAYISYMPRSAFSQALAVATLSESIAPHLNKAELITWVMRTACDNSQMRVRILQEADQLASIDDFPPCLIAAHRLLRWEGSAESISRIVALPPEPPTDWNRQVQEHNLDPCNSFFALTRDECIHCLTRHDVPTFRMVNKARSFWPDPQLPVPAAFHRRIQELLPALNSNRLWQERGRAAADSALESIRPALLACDPVLFADQIRTVFRNVASRSPDALWSLSLSIDAYSLLFNNEILERLRDCWASLLDLAAPSDQRRLEWTLFNTILPLWSAEEQLQRLLARPADAFDLRDFILSFKEVTAHHCNSVTIPEDATSQRRAAWFLARGPGFLESRYFPLFVRHADSYVRSLALKCLYQFGFDEARRDWARTGWRHEQTMHPEESHWGSLILAQVEEVEAVEAADRMHPAYMFELGNHRDWAPDATFAVAEKMKAWLTGIAATINIDAAELLPPLEISDDLSAPTDSAKRFRIRDIAPDQSVHYIHPTSIWGGMFAQGEADTDIFKHESETEWRQRIDRVYAAADSAKRRGALWLDRQVSVDSVEHFLLIEPSFTPELMRMLEAQNPRTDQFIVEAYGVLTAICGSLLRSAPETGAIVYRRLKSRETAVMQIDRGTKQDWADVALFNAPQSEHTTALWEQKLEQCQSDGDLLSISILANRGSSRQWLTRRISLDLKSERLFLTARAVMLAAMLGIDVPSFAPGTWLHQVNDYASRYRKRAEWSRTWFDRFLAAESEDEAFAAFGLLLECIDRRFWGLKNETGATTSTPISVRRSAFLIQNLDEIQRTIKRNEKSMFEKFIDIRVREAQAWPWLDAPVDGTLPWR